MVWTVNWDGDFVVGGDGARRLTPNFRLREFRRGDGSVRVHRELVSALQLLRNRFGRGLSVKDVDSDGLGAKVAGDPVEAVLEAADGLEEHRLFEQAVRTDDQVRVRIPDPTQLPPIGLAQALETAFSVTAAYETNGDKFQAVAGNFDDAGLSFGPAQVNFRSGTIEPVFEKFRQADEAELRRCFGEDYDEWQAVLALPTKAEKIAWADSVSTGPNKSLVAQPWVGYLKAVGRVERFRTIMAEEILRAYGRKALKEVRRLGRIRPDIQIDHLRCLCALYDVAIQQGGLSGREGVAEKAIRERVAKENPRDQFEFVRIAVEERGKKANEPYRADCISRRVGILDGVPTSVTHSGKTSQRANISFYMLRDVRVKGAAEIVAQDAPDVDQEMAQLSRALATGGTLLA